MENTVNNHIESDNEREEGHVDTLHHNLECDNPDKNLGCDPGIDVGLGKPVPEQVADGSSQGDAQFFPATRGQTGRMHSFTTSMIPGLFKPSFRLNWCAGIIIFFRS